MAGQTAALALKKVKRNQVCISPTVTHIKFVRLMIRSLLSEILTPESSMWPSKSIGSVNRLQVAKHNRSVFIVWEAVQQQQQERYGTLRS